MAGDEFDIKLADNIVFGCTKSSDAPDDHVEDLWANNQDDEYIAVKKAVLEIHSKPPRPELSFPEFMKDSDYRHGVTSSKSNEDAKQLIYAICDTVNKNNAENNCIPGQQKSRNYTWPVNPESTTFGIKGESATSRGSSAGVAEALCINDDCNDNLGTTCAKHDPDKIFGKSTSFPNSSAADCLGHTAESIDSISGEVDDIGKSLTPGFRNASTSRCFGCPSIRTDIPKYERASVADTQNYGDDVDAGYLLRPSLFSSFGLEEDEFLKPRSKDYIKRLFRSCGMRIDDHAFEEIFDRVSDCNNFATIDSFRNSMEEFN